MLIILLLRCTTQPLTVAFPALVQRHAWGVMRPLMIALLPIFSKCTSGTKSFKIGRYWWRYYGQEIIYSVSLFPTHDVHYDDYMHWFLSGGLQLSAAISILCTIVCIVSPPTIHLSCPYKSSSPFMSYSTTNAPIRHVSGSPGDGALCDRRPAVRRDSTGRTKRPSVLRCHRRAPGDSRALQRKLVTGQWAVSGASRPPAAAASHVLQMG